MARRKKKRRSLFVRMADGLLSLIDFLCERLSAAAVALLSGLLRGTIWLLRGILRGLLTLVRAAVGAPVRALGRLTAGRHGAQRCLRLDGPEFENYVALVLRDNGFKHVEVTRTSGDQGVDILAQRGGKLYGIQCKNYAGAVGNAAVQEAYAGAQFYGCDEAAVICPGEFTRSARELAASTGVLLWDGKRLSHMMKISGRRPRHSA